MTNQEKEQRIIAYVQAYNQFDISAMVKNLSPKIIFENISNGNVTLRTEGIEAFSQQAQEATSYFQTRQQDIHSIHWVDQKAIVPHSTILLNLSAPLFFLVKN